MKQIIIALCLLAGLSTFGQQPVPPAATQAQVNAGTATFPYVSPATLAGWTGAGTNGGSSTNLALLNLTGSPALIYSSGQPILNYDGINDIILGTSLVGATGTVNGGNNVAIGQNTFPSDGAGQNNVAIGNGVLGGANSSFNVAIGDNALSQFSGGGSNNVAIGYYAGYNYNGTESSNILVGAKGIAGENNIIRIGAGQTDTYLTGTVHGNGGGLTNIATSFISFPYVTLPSGVLTAGASYSTNLTGSSLTIIHVTNGVAGNYIPSSILINNASGGSSQILFPSAWHTLGGCTSSNTMPNGAVWEMQIHAWGTTAGLAGQSNVNVSVVSQ